MEKTTLADKVQELGDAGKYREQARAFLEATGAKIEARYLATRPHFGESDKDARDVYEVRISRGSRSYSFEYGDSIANTEERIAMMLRPEDKYLAPRIRVDGHDAVPGMGIGFLSRSAYVRKVNAWSDEHKKMLDVQDADAGQRPDAYSVLACLQKYEPPQDVDDFAAEYGYTKPSDALRVFEAVKKEYAAMQSLFTDYELGAAQAIA